MDLEAITGAIILRDAWSNVLDKVTGGVSQFEDSVKSAFPNVASIVGNLGPAFKVAEAAIAATTAAVAGLGAATFALASQGADVLDVAGTFEHFSGSAGRAADNLDSLRRGVKDTVDDMTLMQEASRILSAGVKLGAKDFETMSSAAFVLQNRGLGPTNEQLNLISDALVTGRTRALAMKLGVIDLGDAQANYAKSLGVEVEMLSDAGKAEAARIQVMKMLSAAVADAGEQQKDFGEKIDTALTALKNWVNDLAVAVTQSSQLTAMVDTLGSAFTDAFGGDQETLIKTIVGWIESGLNFTVNFGLATIEAARIIHTAWSTVKTAIYAVATVISTALTAIAELAAGVMEFAASLPGATDGMKSAAAAASAFRDSVAESTISLAANTAESAKGIIGASNFDRTLDKMGGTLFAVKDAMAAAARETGHVTAEAKEGAQAQNGLAEATKNNNAAMIDQAKVAKQQAEGLVIANKLLAERDALIVSMSGTTTDKQIADIQRWKTQLILDTEAAGKATKEFYDAVEALSEEKTKLVLIDWDFIRSKSIAALEEAHDRAVATYNEMAKRSHELTRGALEEQRQKVQETSDALRNMGEEASEAGKKGVVAAETAAQSYQKWADGIREAANEAKRLREGQSYSFGITSENAQQVAKQFGVSYGDLLPLLKKGYSFEQALYAVRNPGAAPPASPGPRVPGFQAGVQNFGGGLALLGERGPELVHLPTGSNVIPNNRLGLPTSGGDVHLHFYVNGTGEEITRRVKDDIMKTALMGRLFG